MHTRPSNNNYLYSINGQTLNEVAEHEELGITISSDLKVANHCQHACSKANRMLGLIKLTIKHKNISAMVQLYKSLVKPHLEYCSPAWNPHYSKDKAMLERVQHRFTRLFTDLRVMMYEARLKALKLRSFEERRNRADLIKVYKLMHDLLTFQCQHTFRLLLTAAQAGTPRSLSRVIATLMRDCAFSHCVLSTVGTVCLKK